MFKDMINISKLVTTMTDNIRNEMSKHLYVTSTLFTELLKLKISLPKEEALKADDIYTVWTTSSHKIPVEQFSFYTTKEVNQALNLLLKNTSQSMFDHEVFFDYSTGIVTFQGMRFEITGESFWEVVCEEIANSESFSVAVELLNDKLGDSLKLGKEEDNYFRGKVRHMNERILKELGVKNLFKFSKAIIYLNPVYTRKNQ